MADYIITGASVYIEDAPEMETADEIRAHAESLLGAGDPKAKVILMREDTRVEDALGDEID